MMFGFQIPRLLAELSEWKAIEYRLDVLRLEVDADPEPTALTRRRWRIALNDVQVDADKLRG